MYKTTCFFIIGLLSFTSLTAQDKPTVVDTSRILVQDSLSQDWTTRSPLSDEEKQRRLDNRAEVENMKKRFRKFHKETEEKDATEQAVAEEENYLWAAPESGGQAMPAKQSVEKHSEERPEELRMEIGRNLQEGRSVNNPSVPNAPLLPAYEAEQIPQEYNTIEFQARSVQDPSVLENTIQSSLQTTPSNEPDWQAKVGTSTPPLLDPEYRLPLSAGQILTLSQVQFDRQQSELSSNSKMALDDWAILLKSYPTMVVEVRAYTFGNADAIAAQQLTRDRAQNITNYWLQEGVKNSQLTYRGYGLLSPLVPSSDPDAQQKNERIELIILEMPAR